MINLKENITAGKFLTSLAFGALICLPLLPSYSYAEYFKLKNPPPEVKLYTYQDKGRVFDTDYTKGDGSYDKRYNGLIELYTCASTWHGLSEASIRGIDYRDFEIKADLPEGSKINCGISVNFEYGGYVNTASSGSASGYFLVQMDMGFLTAPRFEAWNHPVIGKTVYKKSNFRSWYEKVIDLGNQTAQDQLQDIALEPLGEGPSLAISAIQQLCEYGADAMEADLITSGELSGAYNNLWLTIDTQYRTYLTLELRSQAEAPGQSITDNFSYICFYDHSPVKGKDFRGSLPRKGFRITKVQLAGYDRNNIVVPDTYACPIIDIDNFKPRDTDPKKLKTNTPEVFEITFINKGKLASSGCKAAMETSNPAGTKTISVPALDPGEKWVHQFEHTFAEYSPAEFKITIDPEKLLDRYVDLTVVKKYTYNLTPKCDLLFIKPVTVEREDKEEGFQTKKKIIIKGKIKNDGAASCEKAVLKLTRFDNVFKKAEFKNVKPQEERDFSFEFMPEEKCVLVLKIETQPPEQESDKSNNEYKIEIGEVEESKVVWRVKEEDVKITPDAYEINKPVRFDLAITNDGNAIGEEVKGTVYVDGGKESREELIKFEFVNVPAGGKAPIDNLAWTPKKKGTYYLCVEFDKDATKAKTVKRVNFRKRLNMVPEKKPELLPDTSVIESSIRHDEDKEGIYFTVHNSGGGYANVKAELYRVFGDGTARDMRTNTEQNIGPNDRLEMYLRAPSGNFKYKAVLTTKGARGQIISTKEFYYTCKEFTPNRIGPNLEVIGMIVSRGKYTGNAPFFDPDISYAEDNQPAFIYFTFMVANTGNVPCELPDCEGAIINKKYTGELPEYKAYEDTEEYKYSYWEHPHNYKWIIKFLKGSSWLKPSRIMGFAAQRHRQPLKIFKSNESDETFISSIEPIETRDLVTSRRAGAYFNCVAFFKGDYLLKFALDTDDIVKNDVLPEDGGVVMDYSIPDLVHRIRTDKLYMFLLKEGIPHKVIKAHKDHVDEERRRLKTTPELVIFMPGEAAGFGIRREKVVIGQEK